MLAGEDAPKSIRVTLTTGPLELSQQDLKRLSWEQHVHIWRVCLHLERGHKTGQQMYAALRTCTVLARRWSTWVSARLHLPGTSLSVVLAVRAMRGIDHVPSDSGKA